MGLFTLHNFCASYSLDYLKSKLESKSRLPIRTFSAFPLQSLVDINPDISDFNYNFQLYLICLFQRILSFLSPKQTNKQSPKQENKYLKRICWEEDGMRRRENETEK